MAFIWNDESLAILRENAGILTTEQIAQLLHTNITAVRNMAYRLKLSLRVTAYNHRRIAQVQALYASENVESQRDRGENRADGQYRAIYRVREIKKISPYATTEYVSFETEERRSLPRCKKEFVDTERSLLDNISDNTRFRELYLTDGTFYCARNIKYEVFISGNRNTLTCRLSSGISLFCETVPGKNVIFLSHSMRIDNNKRL